MLCLIFLVLSLAIFEKTQSEEVLVWSDEFDDFNEGTWEHMVATYPNEGFQYYRNNRKNSWVENGVLNLMPTLTADEYGEEFLYSGKLDLHEEDPEHPCNIWWGLPQNCISEAGEDIVKPVQAARIKTGDAFSFKYGRVEVRAKLPLVSWMRPAIWMMPRDGVYGGWPASGELDLMESSGNRDYYCGKNSRGVDWVQTNVHFGPDKQQHWSQGVAKINKTTTFADAFHIWELIWTEKFLAFKVDGEETYRLTAPGGPGSLFDMAGFQGENIYASGGPMAPFDQEFFFILSSQFGGWPFYDYCSPPAPWGQHSHTPRKEFWEAKNTWIDTWSQPFQLDYIRVYKDEKASS